MTKKKKIIFVLTVLGPGGAERVVSTIANSLPRNEYQPQVILFQKDNGYADMLNPDVEILETKTLRIRNSLIPILKFFKTEKPDIVFASFGEVNAYISLFIKLFPKIKFIARETNVVSNHVTRPEIKFFYRFYNNYHKIICQSDDMYIDLLQNFGIAKEKLVKINNPVDFGNIESKLKGELKPIEYTTDQRNIIAMGNLSARKGFDLLLQVFSHLKNEDINLFILGDGSDHQKLLLLKEQLCLDKVHFLGVKKNPYPYLKFANLFILSSRYEGFPNALLEAGACGTYALANNCPGGITEIVQSGINGEVALIENTEEFAQKIKEILNQKHDADVIKNSIKSRFSKEIILEQYQKIFQEI